MKGCVGALDGYLPLIGKPICKNGVNYYFSQHYFHYGLNCQAMCNHKCRFMMFEVVAPGRCPGNMAIEKLDKFIAWLNDLPTSDDLDDCYFIVSDCAYSCNRKVATPFRGSQKAIKVNDSYNFYLSQLRIKIE